MKLNRNKMAMLMIAIMMMSVVMPMASADVTALDNPPELPVKVKGDVTYQNGTRVPDGWLVTLTDVNVTAVVGNDTTEDKASMIPQYEILVDPPTLIIEGHVIEASVSNDGWSGNVTHTVQSGETAPGSKITMDDIVVEGPTAGYDLTISSGDGGNVTEPGEGTFTYNLGKVVNLTAEADTDYVFVNWTGDVSEIADVNADVTTVTMSDNYTITANFKSGITQTRNLTISSGDGGNVTEPSEGTFTYNLGKVVNLKAEADTDYVFVNWTGDVSEIADVNAEVTTVTMNDNYTITANFKSGITQTRNLTISSGDGGNVTEPGEGTFTYNLGKVVNLKAEADTDYVFVNWTGDVSEIADVNAEVTTVTMNDNYTITANFKSGITQTRNLTISSGDGGNVTEPGEGTFTYNLGKVVNLKAEADADYVFVNWTGDVSEIADVNADVTTVTMSDNYTITANFKEGGFILPYAKMPAGTTYISKITADIISENAGKNATIVFFGETVVIDSKTYDVTTITKPVGITKMYTAADDTDEDFTMKQAVTEIESGVDAVNLTFDPAYVLLDYPLMLGKTWTSTTNVTGIVNITGNETQVDTTAEITGTVTEDVYITVPYGEVHCLVVEVNANLEDPAIVLQSKYWMAQTEAGMPIIPKCQNSAKGITIEELELIEIIEEKPTINSVSLSPTEVSAGATITVTVDATDNVGVTKVTANEKELTQQDSGNIWEGTITAASDAGTYPVTVIAYNAAGHTATDNTKSYTVKAPTPTPTPRKRGGGGGGGGVSDTDGDGYSDIEEIIVGTDPYDPCDPNPACLACIGEAIVSEVITTPKPTPYDPTKGITPATTKPVATVPPPEKEPEKPEKPPVPGFEAVFAIAGLLAVAYLVQKRKK